jgi:serine/threonine protein kinase
MPAPTTSEELLDLVRKSEIVEVKRLDAYVAKLRADGRLGVKPGLLAGMMIKDGLLTHFQAEQLVLGKWRRFTIGKYKVLERLGQGGMGSVYLCEHKLMRRRVAVKVLPTAKASAPEDLERFYREARAVAALDHPNIVHAYDIDQDDTLHFLVMEYVDGISLQDLVKRNGPLDPVRAAHYIEQTAQGLAHAHLAGLVHRDIKPGNLLVDRQGVVKILDMGLARFFNDEEDILTRKYDQNVLGTADYLSPEQVEDSHEVDTRADIYSLGATFYFLLTGRTPFEEGTVAQKLMWHRTRKPKTITAYRQDVPRELLAVLDKMMEKRPEDRYQHPLDVSAALRPWTEQPIRPPSETEIPRLSAAAVGSRPADAPTNVTSPKPSGSSTRRQWQISAPGTQATTAAPRPPATSSPTAETRSPSQPATVPETPAKNQSPAKPAPAVPVLPAPLPAPVNGAGGNSPVSAEEKSPWDVLDEIGADVTSGAQPSTIRPRAGRSSGKQKSRKVLWLCLALVGVAIALAVAITVACLLLAPASNAPRPHLRVGKAVTGSHGYKSIQQALKTAHTGDTIELWDEQHQENVIVSPKKGATAVTLCVAPGKTVVWTSPKGAEAKHLIQFDHAREFRIEGEGLTLDGQDKTETLILGQFECPGLTLANVHLQGFTSRGVHLISCTGTSSDPIRFEKLTFVCPPKNSKARALVFSAADIPTLRPNDFIQILECRFSGFEAGPPVERTNPKATGKAVEISGGFRW